MLGLEECEEKWRQEYPYPAIGGPHHAVRSKAGVITGPQTGVVNVDTIQITQQGPLEIATLAIFETNRIRTIVEAVHFVVWRLYL